MTAKAKDIDPLALLERDVRAFEATEEKQGKPKLDAPKTRRIAVLDDNGVLTGAQEVDAGEAGIDPGDLPIDGTYKWMVNEKLPDGGQFVPLGHGFGKIMVAPPYSTEYVLAIMIEANGDNAPAEAQRWLGWYNDNLRRREEESAARRLKA